MNLFLVFHPESPNLGVRALRYVIVTCFSSYVLQSVVIHFATRLLIEQGPRVRALPRRVRAFCGLSEDAVDRNMVKGLAVAVGLLWNFSLCRAWVYVG